MKEFNLSGVVTVSVYTTVKAKSLEEAIEITRENNRKTKQCKVLFFGKRKLSVDFNGMGIVLDCESLPNEEYVTVEYSGEIGKQNFRVVLV